MKATSRISFVVGAAALLFSTAAMSMPADRWFGKPQVQVGRAVAAYAWQSADGRMHVRVTTPYRNSGTHRVRGALCTTDGTKLGAVQGILLEKDDSVVVNPGGRCVRFAFTTNGHIDGFAIGSGAKGMVLSVRVDGRNLDPAAIYIGRDGSHPAANPATYQR
jgi:hypothetical protein